MDYSQREEYIDWICADYKLVVGERRYLIRQPNEIHRQIGHLIYRDCLRQCEEDGVPCRDDLKLILTKKKFWSTKKDKEIKDLTKNLETLKVNLYEEWSKTGNREKIEEYIAATKEMLESRYTEQSRLDSYSKENIAQIARFSFLISVNTFLLDKNFEPISTQNESDAFLDDVIAALSQYRPSETAIREISRTDPWRSTWSLSDKMPVVSYPASSASHELKSLIGWSQFYDNIQENPDCPSDEQLESFDCTDGWCIIQRRKRLHDKNQAKLDQMLKNPKIANSSEIFIPAASKEDLAMVDGFNDVVAKSTKKVRMAALKKAGELAEAEMPDTKQRIQMAQANMGKPRG